MKKTELKEILLLSAETIEKTNNEMLNLEATGIAELTKELATKDLTEEQKDNRLEVAIKLLEYTKELLQEQKELRKTIASLKA